ncbi:MAG TPA: Arc family DNA-binding protein [Ktedonobacterales bacterium]|nr:Arc family DNA-binding protein [Ktedonobacterales bacterium]
MDTHTPPNEPAAAQGITRLMLRLPRDVAERLRRLARLHDRSLNGEIVRALRAYVEREERERGDSDNERSGE